MVEVLTIKFTKNQWVKRDAAHDLRCIAKDDLKGTLIYQQYSVVLRWNAPF